MKDALGKASGIKKSMIYGGGFSSVFGMNVDDNGFEVLNINIMTRNKE